MSVGQMSVDQMSVSRKAVGHIYVARFCHQVAAWIPDMFCNFYLMKHHEIANNSATAEAEEKISARSGILTVLKFF